MTSPRAAARSPSTRPAGSPLRIADDLVFVEPHPRRVQAVRAGRTVIDTERVLLVHRKGHPLSYAFRPTRWPACPPNPNHWHPATRVPWDAVDNWFEEGRQLVHYPPNPYHRVDCRPTRRRLRVEVAGVTLVDTTDTMIVLKQRWNPAWPSIRPGAHRPAPAHRDDELLQLQGTRDVLGLRLRGHRRRGRRVELPGADAGNVAHQGLSEFRSREGRHDRRATVQRPRICSAVSALSFE